MFLAQVFFKIIEKLIQVLKYILIIWECSNIESLIQNIQNNKRNTIWIWSRTNNSLKHISSVYNVPKSSLYRMIKLDRSKLNSESEKINILYDNEGLNNEERRWIEKQIIPPQAPLTIEKLNKNMCEVFSIKDRKRDKIFFKESDELFL